MKGLLRVIGLLSILACSSIGCLAGDIRITELMPRNVSYMMNEKYDFSGWVEFYNASSDSFYLSDLFVSDGSLSWQCEMDSLVGAKSYFVLYFDELGESNHVNFKLSPEGGALFLYDTRSGALMDAVDYPETYRNVSYGLLIPDTEDWGFLQTPSPGKENNQRFHMDIQSESPTFNIPPGFYDSEQIVEITSSTHSAKIYYTTDGTEPFVCDSLMYKSPIVVNKNTPIRAISVEPSSLPSEPLSGTFFVGEREISLPVVSLVVDPKFFFDDDLGIYVEGNGRYTNPSATCGGKANYWGDESRPCNFELFVDGEQKFSQEVKTKNSGACSRRFPKKSMKINASGVVGMNRLDYAFFSEKPNLKWKSIVLRNDGNDLTFGNSILIRDGFIQSLLPRSMNIDHLSFQPSVVFINGLYYGVLNIRERSDEGFVYSNYGLDEESICFGDNVKKPIDAEYLSLRDVLSGLETPTYSTIDSLIDIDEWLNYFMMEVYSGNSDWPLNNTKFWKRKENGKWRYILFDLDFGFWGSGSCGSSVNTIPYAEKNPEFAAIIKNDTILKQYICKYIVNAGTIFSNKHVKYVLDSLLRVNEPELLYYWENELGRKIAKWETNKEKIHSFVQERPAYVFSYLKDHYSLGDTASLRIFTEEQGTEFYLNCERVDISDFRSYCFSGFELNLTCCPPDGYRFDHWEITAGDSVYRSDDEELQTVFRGPTTYHAVLKKDDAYDGMPKLFLNEICATNKMYVDEYRESDDWIEIYNAGSTPVDLGGMYLSDGKNNLTKYQIPDDSPAETTVPAHGYIVFWTDEQDEQGPLHTNFSLSASKKEKVSLSMLKDDELVVLDSITYELHEKGETFARFSYDGFGCWTKTKWPTFYASNRLLGYELVREPDVTETTLLDDCLSAAYLSVIPNPVEDVAWIKFPWKHATYSIYNNGLLCMTGLLSNGQSLNLHSLPSGFYVLSLEDNETRSREYVKILKR